MHAPTTTRIDRLLTTLAFVIGLFSSCQFQEQANQKFGDQHFKTTISLIELHKTRFGEYPASLYELKYVGDWDKIALASVKYEKVDSGYVLNLTNGWMGVPDSLSYPAQFWQGLGLVKSNMKR